MYTASSIKRVASRTATSSSRFMSFKPRNVVVVEGCRIPFTMAGSVYGQYLAVDLARFALKGLLTKTALDPKLIDYLYYGTVIQEARTSNIAREAAMGAGIPISVPSNTISMACISANQAITAGAEKIMSGQADIVVAGGVETFSDVPIRFSRPIRQRMLGNTLPVITAPLIILYSQTLLLTPFTPLSDMHSYSQNRFSPLLHPYSSSNV